MRLVTNTQPPGDGCSNENDASEGRRSRTRTNRTGHTLVDRYVLTRKIGEGGMGEVYEARHRALGRRVAVKLLHEALPQRDSCLERFSREAVTLASLSSEHIVAVTDFDRTQDGLPFMVMEYLEGDDLRKLLKRYSILPVRRAVKLVADACEGVKVAHARGLVHRDIKPENLFVCTTPSGKEHCKVLDFGVAKQSDASTLTRDGALIGTVRYMAPEQALGKKDIDGRVDVFALGSILYECLCGEPAFDGDRPETILFAIIHRKPTPLSELNPDIPPGLEQIVTRALERDPDHRYATIAEFADALATFLRRAEASSAEAIPPNLRHRSASNGSDTTLGGSFEGSSSHLPSDRARSNPGNARSKLGFVGALVVSACLGAVATTAARASWSHNHDLRALSDSPTANAATTNSESEPVGVGLPAESTTATATQVAHTPLDPGSPPAAPTRTTLLAQRVPKPDPGRGRAPTADAAQTQASAEPPVAGPSAELALDLAPNPYR